jgi:anti-anti-sigma factor
VSPELEDPLTISASRDGDRAVLVLRGELDPHTAPRLQDEIDRAMEDDAKVVILDLAELGFIDSSGLRVIISAHKEAAERGGRLVLRSPSPTAKRLLDITGLLDHIEIGEG